MVRMLFLIVSLGEGEFELEVFQSVATTRFDLARRAHQVMLVEDAFDYTSM
jgi:hypothetical protein